MACEERSSPKLMLVLAMDFNGICYYELLARNETMNGARYLEFLKRLFQKWHANRRHAVWLLDNNARAHRTTQINQWLKANKIQRWFQPAYSPDLSPCDYGCFHQLKRAIDGVSYATKSELRQAFDKEIMEGLQTHKYLAVRALPERWQQYITLEGDYL